MAIRNRRYPFTKYNIEGRCFTCGSDCTNDGCPRQCNEYGPVLNCNLEPIDPALVAVSNELGTLFWLRTQGTMQAEIVGARKRLTGPALTHLERTLSNYGM